MDIKWQAIILLGIIFFSLILFRSWTYTSSFLNSSEKAANLERLSKVGQPASFDFQSVGVLNSYPSSNKTVGILARNWSILDPEVNAKSVLIESLDKNVSLFHYNISETWPLASLTKLLTAVVFLENSRPEEKVTISQEAVVTEGGAGGLKAGEIYNSRDLLKIMILTSSNDAAAALAESLSQKNEPFDQRSAFVKLMNQKAKEIGMTQTEIAEPVGLSAANHTTAADLLLLTEYIFNHHPEIFTWSRLPSILVQPFNRNNSHKLNNINPLVENVDFLGGKTGTTDEAGGNLLSIFSLDNDRLLVIILGSSGDRFKQDKELLNWVNKAYYLK